MKKRKTLLALLSTSLLLGVVAISFINNKNEYQEVSASSSDPVSGTFYRVKDIGQLGVGEKVIFVSEDGSAMDDIWGNPGYLHGGKGGVALSADKDTVTLTNSNATIFTVEAGTETAVFPNQGELPSFAFSASMMVVGQKKSKVYFAHNEKEYYGDNTFEYIGYFKDHDIGVDVTKNRDSSWFIQFSGAGESFQTHIRNGKSVLAGDYTSEVTFTYNYAPRFCSNNGQNVNIYMLSDESLSSVIVTSGPETTDYTFGDSIDLTGLVFEIHTPSGTQEVIYSKEHDGDYTYTHTAYGEGEVMLPIQYNGKKFTITINVSRPEYTAIKCGQLADYRGSYMLVEDGKDYGFDAWDAESNPATCKNRYITYKGNGVVTTNNSGNYGFLRFDVIKDNSGYHLKSTKNHYLDLDSFTMSESSATVIIEHTLDGERVKSTTGKYLYFNNDPEDEYDQYKFGVATEEVINANSYYKYVYLYKYPLTSEEQTSLDTYVANFLTVTNVCKEDGSTFSITESNWNTLATGANGFSSLTGTVQAEIINTDYVAGEEYMTDLQFAMSRYDYIYCKYHSTLNYITDFIGRSAANTMQNLYSSSYNISPVIASNNNDVITAVIIAIAISSLLLVSFVIYKKKSSR